MENKTGKTILLVVTVLILMAGTFAGGIWVGYAFTNNTPAYAAAPTSEATGSQESTPAATDLDTLFAPFWQAWQLVHEQYVDQPVDDTLMMQGAIRGMMESLGDAHTSYIDPDSLQQINAPLEGEYDGIGAYVDTTTEYLTIVSPIPNTPAERAGLKAGDQIIAIDGEDMTGMDANLVLRKVLGEAGTQVTLTVVREGENAPFDVTLTRETINIPSVTTKMLDGGIAYVQITTFGAKTTDDLNAALEELMAQNPTGMILDLRNNGGGYLNTAIDVVSQFVPDGVALYEEYGSGERQPYNIQPGGLATEIPLVVLVNDGTASASEITAGAIQDTGRGVLIGIKTYGKGTVQQVNDLVNSQGSVRITVAHWLTPNGRMIDKVGLEPDIVVERTEEDINNKLDPQLDRAIEYLTNGE